MNKIEFVYTTYINSTPEKLWEALTNPEFTKQYWGQRLESDWKKGSNWESPKPNGTKMVGKVLESMKPSKLVYTWASSEDTSEEGTSRVTYNIEQVQGQDFVKLSVMHDKLIAGSEMAKGISGGWPLVLSNLKTFLEGGNFIKDIKSVYNTCGSDKKMAS